MRTRILFISLLITVVGILVYSLLSTQVYYNSSVAHVKDNLQVYMNAYDEQDFPIYADDTHLTQESAQKFSDKLNGARVTFMDGEGNVLGDSVADEIQSDHSDREEVKDARLSGEGFAVRSSSTVG
ncbi:MAG: hypothetical protein ACI4L9_03580, partial [Candidatus Coproplasma sp.]